MLLLLGHAMRHAGAMAGWSGTRTLEASQAWWTNAPAYAQAMKAAVHVLEELKPKGDSEPQYAEQLTRSGIDFELIGFGCANCILEEAATGRSRTSNGVERAMVLHRCL